MGVPIYMAKKTGMPVLMRVSRAEEALFGSSRPAFQGRIKMGFRADGRITAVDLYIVQQNGPYNGGGDLGGAAGAVSLSISRLRCATAACRSARTRRRRARSAARGRTRSRRRSSR